MKTATVLVFVSLFAFLGDRFIVASPPDALLDKLRNLYPERFTMYHRVILTVRGKNYDFNGYLNRADDRISAVGFNEMGGRLFNMTSSQQKVEVVTKPDRMPTSVLRNYVIPELNAMFIVAMFEDRTVEQRSAEIVLIRGRRNIEYVFNSTLERCETITITEGREKISVIQLRDYRMFAGWNQEIPQTITVLNQKCNYEMTLRLLQINSS